jgi:Xaa-Pro aminopeptidase
MLDGPAVIPDGEIDARVATLQRMMSEHGLAAVLCFGAHRDYAPADLWYLARWSCIDEETSYVFVPGVGVSTLITDAEWDLERSRVEARAGSIAFDAEPARSLGRLVRKQCRAGDRIGVSGLSMMPAPVYLELASMLPEFRLEDATSLTAGQRVVKSELELDLMREAARISDIGLAAGVAAMVEGVPEFEVAAAAECAIRSEGAELSFTTVMGSGPRTALTTFLPTDRRLARGDIAVLDCGARVAGYHGDMCRSTVVGPPTAEQRRMLDAAKAAVEAGIRTARPGARIRDVHEAARAAAVAAGFGESWWGSYMPHGAGAGQHETPLGLADGDMPLRAGMVLCIEPGIAVPGVGGVVLEQMIAVTDDVCEVMNELPLELWEA